MELIVTKQEALKQRRKLLKLIEQWTRAEIMSRLGRFDNLEYANYYRTMLDKRDEIRELVFGESQLITLAERWGLVKSKCRKKKMKKLK